MSRKQDRDKARFDHYMATFKDLLVRHRFMTGQGLSAKFRLASVTEQIRVLFNEVVLRYELMAFAEAGLGEKPAAGTPEAASYEEIYTMAWAIAERQRRQRGGASSGPSI